MKLFIFTFILIAITIVNCTIFTCDPTTDCVVGGLLVPDPDDCFKFYFCQGPGDPLGSPLDCPDNQYFDTEFDKCTFSSYPGQCTNNMCIDEAEISQGCTDECTGSNFFVADSSDCSLYTMCSPPAPQTRIFECLPPDIYFDGTKCVSDPVKCCDFCTPYCSADKFLISSSREIVDPCDCTRFFICLDIGPVDETFSGSCGIGKYFSEDLQQCMTGTCKNNCSPSQCGTSIETTIESVTTTTTSDTASTTVKLDTTTTTLKFDTTSSTLKLDTTTTTLKPDTTSTTLKPDTTSTTLKLETTTTTLTPEKSTTTLTPETTTDTTTSESNIETSTNSYCKDNNEFCLYLPDGNYPCDTNCETFYYTCQYGITTVKSCPVGQVFNTDPSYPYCIDGDICPYYLYNCQNSFSCGDIEDGNYSRCTTCDVTYYACTHGISQLKVCPEGQVFNNNPYYPYCIDEQSCPYANCSSDTNFCTGKPDGNYQSCSYCDPSYILCISGKVYHGTCIEPLVFNINPSDPRCVEASECFFVNNFCDDNFSCTDIPSGTYPMCNYCANAFYLCINGDRTTQYCGDGMEYNTDSSYPFCVESENCPCDIEFCG